MVEEIRTPGDVKVKVTCEVGQTKVNGVCVTKIKRAKVLVKPLCNDNVTVSVRVRAKQPGKTATVWGHEWRVKNRPFTACKKNANG